MEELESGEMMAICTSEGKEYIYRVGPTNMPSLVLYFSKGQRCGALGCFWGADHFRCRVSVLRLRSAGSAGLSSM